MASIVSLSADERTRIRDAVARAEDRSSGEIVPLIVQRSGRHEIAVWRGACLAAILALVGTFLALELHGGWGLAWLYEPHGPALIVLAAGALGGLAAAFVPPLRRRLAGGARLERAVRQRAARAFFEEEVFATRGRTGVLILVSLFERRVEILADAGINQRVAEGAWPEVVSLIRDGLAGEGLTAGMVAAIERCGELLEGAGLAADPADVSELADEARVRDDL